MSGDFVADSSVAIAWVVQSQSSVATDRLLDRVAAGARLVVPSIWFFEVANTLVMLSRRKHLQQEDRLDARSTLERLRPIVDEDGRHLALSEISDLAQRFSLTIYDATYLELASRRHLPLATRDRALWRAAGPVGVETLAGVP